MQGIAFCEYVDPAATDVAIQGLNGMDLGDKKLKVQKASVGVTQVAGVEMGVAAMSMLAGTTSTDSEETRVLQLLNMVTPEELMDGDDYEGRMALSVYKLAYTNLSQKSRKMSRRSVPSLALFLTLRFLGQWEEVDNLRVSARFSSSLKRRRRPRKHFRHSQDASLLTEPSLRPISQR